MTVEELIDELRALPLYAPVVMRLCSTSDAIDAQSALDEPMEATIDEVFYDHGKVIICAD